MLLVSYSPQRQIRNCWGDLGGRIKRTVAYYSKICLGNPTLRGIPTKTIPFQYLGIYLYQERKKTHAQCYKLVEHIEKILSRREK